MLTFKINDDILLKKINLNDAETIYNAILENMDFLALWLPFIKTTKSVVDTVLFIQDVITKKEHVFVITYKGEFAGLIGTTSIDKFNYRTELGYWLVEKMQRKGIVIRSIKILEEFLFYECGMNRIGIRVAAENIKSNLIALKSEYIFESIENEGFFIRGGFTDVNVYYKLAFHK